MNNIFFLGGGGDGIFILLFWLFLFYFFIVLLCHFVSEGITVGRFSGSMRRLNIIHKYRVGYVFYVISICIVLFFLLYFESIFFLLTSLTHTHLSSTFL